MSFLKIFSLSLDFLDQNTMEPQPIKPSISLRKSYGISDSNSLLAASTEKSSKLSCDSTLNPVSQLDLTKFCPKRIFYIFMISESDSEATSSLNEIVNTSKEYERISSLTFITRDDVLSWLDVVDDYIFPNQLKPLLLDVINSFKESRDENNLLILEGQLLKLKLIQKMYEQLVEKNRRNERERSLEALLNTLARECKKKSKKSDIEKQADVEKKTAKVPKKNNREEKKDVSKDIDIDYSWTSSNNESISYEENIFDYIEFYCIKGYNNADLIQVLIEQLNVNLCGIVKISENGTRNRNDGNDIFRTFWNQVEQKFFKSTVHYKMLENTILMKFDPCDTVRPVDRLQQFIFMLRRIVNLKLSYLKYLRHLKISRIHNTYPVVYLDCLKTYKKALNCILSECISSELVLDGLLKEVSQQYEGTKVSSTNSRSLLLSKTISQSIHCVDPLYNFDAFSVNIERKSSFVSKVNSMQMRPFLVHEKDILTKVLKSYEYIGPRVADISLNLFRHVSVFHGLNDPRPPVADAIHLHDRNPSDDNKLLFDTDLDNFMYFFLFSKFNSKLSLPRVKQYCDLQRNLITFDDAQYWNVSQTKHDMVNICDNIYDTSVVHFQWKENLSKDLLLQEIVNAERYFLYVDRKYSPETDDFLFVFSDKLDHFGLNTKTYDVTVRTPVCFRDFCRYTLVDEPEWLQDNKSELNEKTFEIIFNEKCPGAQKIRNEFKIFEDYAYLLDGEIKELDVDLPKHNDDSKPPTTYQKIKFSDMCSDLEKIPIGDNIIQACGNTTGDKLMVAYDLGTNVFKLTGKITTFCSHDNVKVTVDNTKFFQHPDKCQIKIMSNGIFLTVHSSESLLNEPYVVTLQLSDDSRISFMVSKSHMNERDKSEPKSDLNPEDHSEIEISTNKLSETINQIETEDTEGFIDNKLNESETNIKHLVHCVDSDYIKHLLEGKSLDDLSINGDCDDLLELLLSIGHDDDIYKVNTRTNYLKRRTNVQVPLKNAFRNILPLDEMIYQQPKNYQTFTKRFKSDQNVETDLKINSPIDFRVCLPNGLFIKAHSCIVDKNNLMIKQEYADEKPDVPIIQHEEFRLFSNQGLVLIKKIDGTIAILKANGDTIDFEKPSDGSGEKSSLNPCHCFTLEDYRNKLNKLLKDQDNSEFAISRRGHIKSKQSHILDNKILAVLKQFDIPYLKKSVTKFDGTQIKFQGDTITQKQLHHMIYQQDFFTGEISFERNDELRSLFDRNGSQKTLFPDGTIISNSIDIAEELVDGFVYVTLSFQYEHPYYATIKYNLDETFEIELNNNVVFRQNANRAGFSVHIDKNIYVSVTDEKLLFNKSCSECEGKFEAEFNVVPFRDGSWNPTAEFMRITDSYNKQFCSDFIGNCSRNNDYINGRTNGMKCNHFAKANNYKKLFVVRKELTGDMFITNTSVNMKVKNIESRSQTNINKYNMVSDPNTLIVDCREKVFRAYSHRFYNNDLYSMFDKVKKTSKFRREYYTNFRLFHKLFESVDKIEAHISNMKQIYSNSVYDLDISSILEDTSKLTSDLRNEREILTDSNETGDERKHRESTEKKKQTLSCCCSKQRMTMADKLLAWRKACNKYRKKIRDNEVTPYFKSGFCIIEN